MNETITMPTLSDTMKTGQLVRWVKAAGDAVKSGDTVAEVETDKAVMEVEVFHDGYLVGPLAPVETDLPVGQVIGYIADKPGDAGSSAEPEADAKPKSKAKSKLKAEPEVHAANPTAESPKVATTVPESNVAAAVIDKSAKAASVPDDAATLPPAKPAKKAHPTAPEKSEDAPASPSLAASHPDSSPLARRMAEASGIALSTLHGSGPHGRIVAADVTEAKSEVGAASTELDSQPPTSMSDAQIIAMYPEGSYTLVPHSSMRRTIAQRLVQASIGTPHFDLTIECDIGKLLDARYALNATAPKGEDAASQWKVSVTDYIIKALALALQRVPDANATWTEGGMLAHQRSDIGVAVAIKGGLMAPLICSADTKSLSDIAIEVQDVATRARARKLKAADYEGGGSTVSNLGMDGIRNFNAVLNPPQATILAVGMGEERAVIRKKKITHATMMTVTLTCDHRVVDGALGAQLLAAFKVLIEDPRKLVK